MHECAFDKKISHILNKTQIKYTNIHRCVQQFNHISFRYMFIYSHNLSEKYTNPFEIWLIIGPVDIIYIYFFWMKIAEVSTENKRKKIPWKVNVRQNVMFISFTSCDIVCPPHFGHW